MKLEGLPVGQADAAIERLFGGKLVDAQPLLRFDHATGQTAAQHHVLERLQFLRDTLGTDVAVVLLVHAVKADQLEIVAPESAREAILQVFANGPLQVGAAAFQAFVVGPGGIGQFGAFVHRRAFGGLGFFFQNVGHDGLLQISYAVWLAVTLR